MDVMWHDYLGKIKLLYIGDGFCRENVIPIRPDKQGTEHRNYKQGRQTFVWPNGDKHTVPIHTVVKDTEAVRTEKGLQ